MSSPVYDILLVAHIVAALVGFGAIAAAGWTASCALRSPEPASDEAVRRFFKPGRDWPARAIFLVPLLGLSLLLGGDRAQVDHAWPWVGLTLWLIAAAVATARCWPAERRAQDLLAALRSASPEASGSLGAQFRAACRQMELATGVISVCFLTAVAVMIIQP